MEDMHLMQMFWKYKKYFCTILFVGFIVYFPILYNGFVWDDIPLILNNPEVHGFNFNVLLGSNVFNAGIFYRPLHAIYVAGLYSAFGQQAFIYHFLQLTLHVACACLLFLFFKLFFKKFLALFLSLVFLVHPINVEAVAWISATNNQLYFIFGISAFLLATKNQLTLQRLFFISVLLLLSAFAKETGILFFVMILAYRYLNRLGKLKLLLISGSGVGSIYIFMRDVFAHVTNATIDDHIIPIYILPLSERLMNVPAIFFYYLRIFFYPVNLGILQSWIVSNLDWQQFLLPLIVSVAFILLLFFSWYTLRKRITSRDFVFFVLWFGFGLLPLLQIIPLNMTVADRWFYFPIVGLLGLMGIGIQTLVTTYPRYHKMYLTVAIVLICLFSLRTFNRTFDWKDNISLYGHDLKQQPDNYMLSDEYVKELLAAKRLDEALALAQKSASVSPTVDRLNRLGYIYQSKHQYQQAYSTYQNALVLAQTKSFTDTHNIMAIKLVHENLAALLILENNYNKASQFLKSQAIKKYPDDAFLYFLLTISEANLGHKEDALEAARHSYKLSSDDSINALIYNIQQNRPVGLDQH